MTQRLRTLLFLGLSVSSWGYAQSNRELADAAANVLGVGREGFCSSCHSLNSERPISRWAASTQKVETCLAASGSSKAKLECIAGESVSDGFDVSPSQLGIYAAAVHLDPIKSLVNDTYPSAQAESILKKLLDEVSMPANSSAKLSAKQFSDVQKWFAAGTPELDYLLQGEGVDSSVCKAEYSEDLAKHLRKQNLDSWKTRLETQQTAFFACPTNGAECFTQQRAGSDIFPDVTTKAASRSWKLDLGTSMRTVMEFTANQRRQYWIRTSPDGRFVGFGGNNPSGFADLQPLLGSAAKPRIISVSSLYDPGFFPDGSSFIFQGNTTGMCNMSILENSATTRITFREDACNILDSKVPLYQSIGASLNGDDYLSLVSSYQRDSGLDGTLEEFLPSENLTAAANNRVTLYPLAFDGQSWRRGSAQNFAVPFEIDWVLSHSNELAMSRLQAERDGVVRTNGFKLYKFEKDSQGRYSKSNLATLCGEGLKGDFSFDERFYVTYSYVRADQWKYFGYSSANDPEFLAKLRAGAADLFLHDLYAKKSYALTNMGADQYALFPHFRGDNWIYFEVYDRNTGERSVVVSDAAIKQARETPFLQN